jgi:Y-X(10)_GDL-associated radical SAM protein
MDALGRHVTADEWLSFRPVYVVWELTLACDLKCGHCGSRAGRRRPGELTTEECIDLVRQLARLGAREITLIGGEAYLRSDWIDIIAEIRAQGMNCSLQSGGRNLTEERIGRAAAAGLQAVGVSIDGLRDVHDELRGVKGSFDAAFAALRHAQACGLPTSINTTVTPPAVPQLRELMERIIEVEAKSWRVGITVAMGRAADSPQLLLQPYELLELMPLLAELWREGVGRGLAMLAGNTMGYYGPYESLFRGAGDEHFHWVGCNAGRNTIGIESDGTIKGCPSLPRTPYAGGNIRDRRLEDIWHKSAEISALQSRTTDELWGFCRTCYYADVCLAGCTWVSHSLLGVPGNNPYCHYRALELAKQGLRERVVRVEAPPGNPFDHGRFDLLLEPLDGSGEALVCLAPNAVSPSAPMSAPIQFLGADRTQELPQRLRICRNCKFHTKWDEKFCPNCNGDLEALEKAYKKKVKTARAAGEDLQQSLDALKSALAAASS